MASIFKRGRDRGKRRAVWYISYDDENGKRRTKKGHTDKRSTEELAYELERNVRRRKEGLVDADDDERRKAKVLPIEDHLTLFEKSIGMTSTKHVKLTMSRVRRIVTETEFTTLADIDIESIEAVLGEMLESDEIGRRSYNHYVQAMEQFCTWLVPKRIAASPLVGMKRLNADVDVRHPRRALTSDQFTKLVESARGSGILIQCFTGEERARIYTLSYMTGLRRKELATLTPQSFKLDETPAILTVQAACSKRRRKDVLPLHPELVEMLRDWLKELKPDEVLFPKLAKRRTWLMVKKDLERVGIPYKTEEGIADFHAAGRHTHITELLRNGASLPEARELARHSDIRMTMKYTHIGIDDQARAVSQLPWQRNSGSDDTEPNPEGDTNGDWQRYGSGTRRPTGQSVSPTGTEGASDEEDTEKTNPRVNGGYDAARRDVTPSGTEGASVEAAGIEPASRDISMKASTCVVDYLGFAASDSNRQDSAASSREQFLTSSVLGMTQSDPELRPTFGSLRQRPAVGVAFARRPLRD